MFLAATSLTEFWDADDELLFLGPWCTRYDRQNDWKGRHYRMLPNPWDDRNRFEQAVRQAHEIEDRFLNALASRLNEILGTRHSTRYWRILLGYWPMYLVEQMYDHRVHIEDAFRLYPDIECVGLDISAYRTPQDFNEFLAAFSRDLHHLFLYTLILRHLKPTLRLRQPKTQMPGIPPMSKKRFRDRATNFLARQAWRWLPGRILASDLYMRHSDLVRLLWGLRSKALPFPVKLDESLYDIPIDLELRRKLTLSEGNDAFTNLLWEGVLHTLPKIYLEGYHATRQFVMDQLDKTPAAVISAVGWHSNEAFKFAAAECAERGSRILCVQHGAGYGMFEHPGERHERAFADHFYSWGWSALSRDDRVSDLPHPNLCREIEREHPQSSILFLANSGSMFTTRLDRWPIGSQGLDYIQLQERFVRALTPELRKRLLARLFPSDYGWNQHARFRDIFPDVVLDDYSKPFSARAAQARLAVFDHPGTSLLEALAWGVPSIVFWDTKFWEFRDASRPMLDKLKAAGIYHEKPEAAATHAALIWDRTEAWWSSDPVREARAIFCRHFAKTDPDWLAYWVRELRAGASSA